MSTDYVADALAQTIARSLRGEAKEFEWETFFRTWFREMGTPCFFLFRRNLGVTNAQYAELFSLLETYCTDKGSGKPKHQILFHTTEQMKATVTDTINTLLDVPSTEHRAQIKEFARTYREVYASTFAVDMFYSSCAVFVPPGVEVDIDRVCADAGYIHSAGISIYIRNIRKSQRGDFESSLESHVQHLPAGQLPVPFVVYAHEDFSDFDKASRDEINRGIDGTKLYLEKMSMGSHRLTEIVQDLRTVFKNRLEIPHAGSYKTSHLFAKPKTIWLIGDRSVAPLNPLNPGNNRYYICYQQHSKNENPFFYFDENKPAWKSHTTMPHSLTAALINATRPHQPGTTICDPFGGTGTTWFETKRLGLPASVSCSDLSPIMKLLLNDNLHFFLMPKDQLMVLRDQLGTVREAILQDRRDASVDERQASLQLDSQPDESIGAAPYSYAVRLLNDLKHDQPNEDQEFSFAPSFVDKLSRKLFVTRLVFYIVLRAELRYQGGYQRKATTFDKAFEKSLTEILEQTDKLLQLRANLETRQRGNFGTYLTFDGTYSPVIVPSFFTRTAESFHSDVEREIGVLDACDLKPGSLDVVVCDPPYGFNTTEDRSQLANLYSRFLDAALLALREHGHLIICLPAESYTGRGLPYCTYSSLISNQVLVKAHRLKKHVFVSGRSLPHRMLVPPYYWEAERALRRVILHFRLSASEYHLR